MVIRQLVDEDFVNYRKPAMFIGFPYCTWKCGIQECQNGALATSHLISIEKETLVQRYMNNPITSAICCGGLEPFDSWDDLYRLIKYIREFTIDDIVIYTGYYKEEIEEDIGKLKIFPNIIVKYGRFIPGQEKHYDKLLGVYLSSNNQYAERVS